MKLPNLRLPERIPDLRQPWNTLFQLLWFPALLLAIVGPVAGTWYRFTTPGDNSALMLGSRVGLVLDQDNLTRVRFPVGSAAKAAGVEAGDHIVAIDGIPVSNVVPLPRPGATQSAASATDYALFSPIIEGSEPVDLDIALRSAAGAPRNFHVRAGEQHIEQAARGFGLSPALLSVIDLLHIVTYPFLLLAAWMLHRRRREDLNSSILSLAMLLTIGAEQPSADFLTFVAQVPHWIHLRIYDLGNICLLAGILMFPFGQLRPRITFVFLALLPLLFFVSGDANRLAFMAFMAAGVLTLLTRLRQTPAGPERQQIKWALLGFSGYALFRTVAFVSDMTKLHVGSFGSQLGLEVLAGLSFGVAFLALVLGLLVALLCYRLYDAEAMISRSANVALITLGVAAVFGATSDALKQLVYNFYGNSNSEGPVIFAAALATVLINPIQERIQRWSERRFQHNLVMLREELPECVRDMRETASLSELLDEVLARIEAGVRAVRSATVVGDEVARARGIASEQVELWRSTAQPLQSPDHICESADPVFPVRVPLDPGAEGALVGYLLIGPRPDGSIVSKEEQKTLLEMAPVIARAIRTVVKRETRERSVAALIEDNVRRIAELEAKLGGA